MLRFPSSIQRLGGFAQASRCMCSDSGDGPPKSGTHASKGHSLDDLLSGKSSKKVQQLQAPPVAGTRAEMDALKAQDEQLVRENEAMKRALQAARPENTAGKAAMAKSPEIKAKPTDSEKILKPDKTEFTEAERIRAEKVRDKINAVLAKGGGPEMVKISHKKSEESLEQKLKREKGKKAIEAINSILSTLKMEPTSLPPITKAPLDLAKPSKPSKRPADEEVLERRYHGVDVEIVSAIRGVEAEVGGGPRVQSALLDRLAMVSDTSSTQTENLNEMLSSMDVEERKGVPMHQLPYSNAGPLGGDINHMKMTGYGLLNIFTQERMQNAPIPEKIHTPIWDKCVGLELQHSLNQNPSNQWQEFAQWTDQGKIWSFPIDNEISLEEEKATGFQDHVFLERHLHGWCPRVGPIRHFMELVTTALSKNPHMTAARKKENIDWFRDFFEEKRSLLEDIGAFPKKQPQA